MSFSEASKIISMMWNAMGSDTKKVRGNERRGEGEERKCEGEVRERWGRGKGELGEEVKNRSVRAR